MNMTDIAAEAIAEADKEDMPRSYMNKYIGKIFAYVKEHNLEYVRHSDYPEEAHINSWSIEELEDMVMQEGTHFTDADDNPCVLATYGRLLKLREIQLELRAKGFACRDDDREWIAKLNSGGKWMFNT